jgi:hypothetical protein
MGFNFGLHSPTVFDVHRLANSAVIGNCKFSRRGRRFRSWVGAGGVGVDGIDAKEGGSMNEDGREQNEQREDAPCEEEHSKIDPFLANKLIGKT